MTVSDGFLSILRYQISRMRWCPCWQTADAAYLLMSQYIILMSLGDIWLTWLSQPRSSTDSVLHHVVWSSCNALYAFLIIDLYPLYRKDQVICFRALKHRRCPQCRCQEMWTSFYSQPVTEKVDASSATNTFKGSCTAHTTLTSPRDIKCQGSQ